MKIELQENIILTEEEKIMINQVHSLMLEIITNTKTDDVYNAAKLTADGLEELGYIIDLE